MSADFLEKRKHPRFSFRVPLRYRKIQSSTQEFKGTLMKDISLGGLKISAFEFLPINLRLAIEIPLVSGLKAVEGTARVAWVQKSPFAPQYEVGIEFENLNQGDPERINEFLSLATEKEAG